MWARVLGRGGFEPPKALGQLIYSQSRLTASVSARPADFTDNDAMSKRRWILWQGLIAPSMERFIASPSDDGFELNGLILQTHQDTPYLVRYAIRVDRSWRTREVQVELEDGGRRILRLSADAAGHWSREDRRLNDLDGCLDVDLESGHPPRIRCRSGASRWRSAKPRPARLPGFASRPWRWSASISRTSGSPRTDIVTPPGASPPTSPLATTAWCLTTAATGRALGTRRTA